MSPPATARYYILCAAAAVGVLALFIAALTTTTSSSSSVVLVHGFHVGGGSPTWRTSSSSSWSTRIPLPPRQQQQQQRVPQQPHRGQHQQQQDFTASQTSSWLPPSCATGVWLRIRPLMASSSQPPENSSSADDDDDNAASINPYADPNYPDLEFVNYDDPEYSVGQQGDIYGDDNYGTSSTTTDEVIMEEMREDRRRRNDEYQFQTYYSNIWGSGQVQYKGEWTVYYSSTFYPEMDDADAENIDNSDGDENDEISLPRLIQTSEAPLTVVSRARKEILPSSSSSSSSLSSSDTVRNERIYHEETLEQPMGDADLLAMAGFGDVNEQLILQQTYWPNALSPTDFRGSAGIMVCGNAWTICTAVPLYSDDDDDDATITTAADSDNDDDDATMVGPYREYRVELGIQAEDARFRIKLDYSIIAAANDVADDDPPPLHLKTMTVCREAAEKWPRTSVLADSLFRTTLNGAPGGLYDPPPIHEYYAAQYCMVDMDGAATALFPVMIDQVPISMASETDDDDDDAAARSSTTENDDTVSWVTSLDWTAGPMRYQVDRKTYSGIHLRGLRTLELSEVQSADAEQYRPRDGGQNMRQ